MQHDTPAHRAQAAAPKQCRTHFTDDPERIDAERDPHLAGGSAAAPEAEPKPRKKPATKE
jgi:hypothetical protein